MTPRYTKEEPIVEDDIVEDDDDDEEEEEDDDDEESSSGIYEPGEKLQECHWQRRSISDLFDMMSTPFLELNPDYQRDVVWNTDRMTKLINSLICNYYVPPVIFNVQTKKTEDGGERYLRISIDGKQRLSSIREFVNGNIPCTDKDGRKWFFTNNGDTQKKNKRILSEKFKQRFLGQELLCAEYAALERKQEEDLFSRVQLGVPLTPAEKLRASSGAWQAFAIDIEKQYPELMDTVDNRRGRSFQLVLQIFKQLLNSDEQNPKYSAGAAALKGFCDRPKLLDESFKATARRVFHTYNEILRKHPETFENHSYSHATKYSPIEFVASAVMIHQYPQRTNSALLSGDILKMRELIRQERQDLRSNTSTWKALMRYVTDLEKHRGGANVTSRDGVRVISDMSMENAGEGGSSFALPPPKATQAGVEPHQATPRSLGLVKRAAPLTTSPAANPTPSFHSLPQKPQPYMRDEQGQAQRPRESSPQLSAVSTQRKSPKIPLPRREPPTSLTAQRQPLPSSQVRAPIAPFGQLSTRSVADRFRAVNTSPKASAGQSYGGNNASPNEAGDGYSRGGGSSHTIGKRQNKRPRTEYEMVQIKREEEGHHD